MKHTRKEQLRRLALFKRFVEAHPPKMPDDFSHREYNRVIKYAKVAFYTGYNTGENDICRGRELASPSTGVKK